MSNKSVKGHMKKATNNLEIAQMLLNNGMYDGTVSSSYYAVFHAVSALLCLLRPIKPKQASGREKNP